MTTIVIVFLVIYLFYLTSRVSNLERMIDDAGIKTRATLNQSHQTSAEPLVQKEPMLATQISPVKPSETLEPAKALEINRPLTQEDIFSTKTLTVIGVIALVFGVGFFFKLAIDRGWISEWGRILIGLGVGALLIILGDLWRNRYGKYSSALAGGGVAIIYISFLLGSQLYNLYPEGLAFALLILTAGLALLAGMRYKSDLLNYESIIGAFLGPLLLYGNADHHALLFIYLTILNAVILYAQSKRFSIPVLFLGGLGNAVNFVYWMSQFGSGQNSFAIFVFLLAVLAMNVLLTAFMYRLHVDAKRLEGNGETPKLFAVFTAIFGLFLFITAEMVFSRMFFGAEMQSLRAPFQLCAGIIYAMSYVIVDRLEHKTLNYTLAALSALSLVFAAYHQFSDPHLQTVLFVAVGLVGVGASYLFKRIELATLGTIVLFSAMLKALFDPFPMDAIFLLNIKFLVILLVSAAMVIANLNLGGLPTQEFEDLGSAVMILAVLNLWLGVTVDLFHYNVAPTQLLFSVWTLLFAVGMIATGAYRRWRFLRKVAIGLFIFSILKAFLYDVLVLDIGFRVVSFITLGVILLSTSFYYQRNKERVKEFLK